VVYEYDVTSLRPGGGSWSLSDINALEIRVETDKEESVDGAWRIDLVSAQIGCTCQTYQMDMQMDFISVPAPTPRVLELRYSADIDTFVVEVWDMIAGTYRPRGVVLDSASLTTWSYTLTDNEYSGGSVRIRFVDRTQTAATSGTLTLEYARVATGG